jgi:agmatine deiminase
MGQRTPAKDGFSMPAEWAQHDGCLISWPCSEETWCGYMMKAKKAYAEVISAINQFEQVTVLSDPSTANEARRVIGNKINIIEIPLDDSWIRDNGPAFVKSEEGKLATVNFGFNGWGGRFPHLKDSKASDAISDIMRIQKYSAPMILEGGAIAVDGEGTLLTTESCLLNRNRNPDLTKDQIDKILGDYLGIKKVLWVKQGIHGSMIDGHIDGVSAFVRPGTVIHASTKDESDPNFTIMRDNRARLETMTDARGRSIEVVDFPMPVQREIEGHRIAPCYTNFFIAKGGIVAPTFGEANDNVALEILRGLFPKHEVVGVRCEYIGIGGGEVHCITQQIPTGVPASPD